MYRDDKFNKIPVPENLDDIIDQGIEVGLKLKKKQNRKKMFVFVGSIAAAAALFFTFCMSFPTLAGKIPLIGNIFSNVEEKVSYKGNFSSAAQKLVTEEETLGDGETSNSVSDSNYVQTSNGITITVSEVYYNSKAMYLAMSIYNEEEFPDDFVKTENMEGYILDYDRLEVMSEGRVSFYENDVSGYCLEGEFVDKHTFAGIMRIDISNLSYWPTNEELEAVGISYEEVFEEGISAEEAVARGDEVNLKIKEAFPEAEEPIEVPDSFTYDLKISQLWDELFETEESTEIGPDGNERTISDPIRKIYEGEWNFQFNVEIDRSKTQTVEVNDTNENGIGISSVEKTPYEITATEIIPQDKLNYDFFLVICDKNGDLLDYQGNVTDMYQVYGRDTSTVYVYLCDYIEYMDELKGYYWSEDYEEKKKTKTFAQYLEERALYGVEVNFDN